MLNNRELASAILLGLFLLGALLLPDARKLVPGLLRTALGWRLSRFWLRYAALIVGVTMGTRRLGLRYDGSTKDAVVWAAVVGLPMLLRMDQIRKHPDLILRTIREAVGLTAIVEFFVNVYVYPLWVELPLQIGLVVVGVLLAFIQSGLAENTPETETSRKFLTGVQRLAGVTILGTSAYLFVAHWRDLRPRELALSFAQPVLLTVIVMAFTCASALQSAYGSAFARMRLVNESEHPWRANLALVWTLRFRLRKVAEFRAPWMWHLPKTTTWQDALRVAQAYKNTTPQSAI